MLSPVRVPINVVVAEFNRAHDVVLYQQPIKMHIVCMNIPIRNNLYKNII